MERPPATTYLVAATYLVNGTAIRKERKSRGLGTAEAAKGAGISRSYLARLELGIRTHMGPAAYIRLRTYLNSTDDRLLAPTEEHPEER